MPACFVGGLVTITLCWQYHHQSVVTMCMSCGDVCHCYYPQVEERKRPSRVSALYRTTVVEGEALVMRKLVVSGIVAAEKTYLTWLTILKEVSCEKCLCM